MHSIFLVVALFGAAFAAPSSGTLQCNHDNCLRAFIRHAAEAQSFCSTYTYGVDAPPDLKIACDGEAAQISSACSCIYTAPTTSSSSQLSSTTSSTSISATITSSSLTSQSSTSSTATSSDSSISSSSITTTSATSASSTSSPATLTSTTSASSTPPGSPCTCTDYTQIAPAVATCTAITLQDISAPSGSSIDLSKVMPGTVVTFAGMTTFAFTNSSSFNPIILGGIGVTITAAPGAIIDGNGSLYWDGLGSNGGVPKPNHFVVVNKMTGNSVIENLHIQNYPTHCFSMSNNADLTVRDIYLDNSAGDAPNSRSNGLPASHNSDGFDVSGSNNTLITSCTVINQDDCVAITSGDSITVDNMYCSGGHGLSIGSVGGKSNNRVTNILFENSVIINSENGARIKTNFNTTGFISNVTYRNISLSAITTKGIDVQQDYLNGGPTGIPSNGVIIQNILFDQVTGTVTTSGTDYYVLCGDGSCNNIVFTGDNIYGGGKTSSCNYPPTGCPGP